MDLTELKKGPHLSASSINNYCDCGLLYKFGRVDRLPPEFLADSLLFGTAIHRVLGGFYQSRMIGERPLLKELLEIFDAYWREAAEGRSDIRYSEGKDFTILLMEGKELLTVYFNTLPDDNFQVLAIEEGVAFFVGDIPIVGYIDLIEEDQSGTIIVTDWKTTGKAYSMAEVNKNLQVTLYAMALRNNGYADRNMVIKFDCLIKTKKPKFEQYYTVRTPEDERRAIKKIRHVWEGIAKGVFIPNDTGWRCSGCAYQSACKEYLEGDP